MKTIFHDHAWNKVKCRQHGRICDKYVREDGTELHIKTREPKPHQHATDGPPCIGCRGKRKAQQ